MASLRDPMLFEMAWAADPPLLVNPDLGVAKLTSGNPAKSLRSDVTLLDSTDHRLLRSGVVLAHRVVDSLGEWYMDAPGWGPWLPQDCSVTLDGAGELPLDFRCLIKPFLRGAPLSPSAALRCDRREMSLVGPGGAALAEIRDDRITVTRSGVTVSRAREITLTPTADMNPRLRDWVASRVIALGGTQVTVLPSTLERLGPRIGALPDFPRAVPPNVAGTLEGFVINRFAHCLRAVIEADLTARSTGMGLHSGTAAHLIAHSREPGVLPDRPVPDELLDLGADPVTVTTMGIHDDRHGRIDSLLEALGALGTVIDGLSELLEPRWVQEATLLLDKVRELDTDRITVHRMPESYYSLLTMMVVAVRAPKLTCDGTTPARPVLTAMVRRGVSQVVRLCDRLEADSDHGWARARRCTDVTTALASTLKESKRAAKVAHRLGRLHRVLAGTGSVNEGPTPEEVALLTPGQAFEEGRRLERRLVSTARARRQFVIDWPHRRAKLLKAVTP